MMHPRKLLALLLCAVILFGVLPVTAVAEATGLDNFKKVNTYSADLFSDVSDSDWFVENIKTAYELGLMIGQGKQFGVASDVTIAETVTLAARLHSTYYGNSDSLVQESPWYRFFQSAPWYQVYVDYITSKNLVSLDGLDMTAPATRAQFASILAVSLPAEALEQINNVADNAIPDVSIEDDYAEAVYALYRAGVLIGNNSEGNFAPESNIKRNEVAAVVTRMADASLRGSITLGDFYTVTFDLNYSNAPESQVVFVEAGKAVPRPTNPTRTGYSFNGWYTATAGGTKYDFDSEINSDTTVYAHWSYDSYDGGNNTPAPTATTYTVSFNSNGGSEVPTQTISYGLCATQPENPTRDGYSFGGWYSDDSLTALYLFDSAVTKNIVLYANWLGGDDYLDTDADGLPDYVENNYGTDVNLQDTDSDGLTDYEEVVMGTDPLIPNDTPEDTDGDRISDLDELRHYNTDPTSIDTDGDSLNDYDEIFVYFTSPTQKDTDEDGLDDAFEIVHGLNPNNPKSDGSIPDGEVKLYQQTDETCVSGILLEESNAAKPSISGYVNGQLSKNIYITTAIDVAVNEERAVIGQPLLLDGEDEYLDGLSLNFDLSSYINSGGLIDGLSICKVDEDGNYTLLKTITDERNASCDLDGSGSYFIIDVGRFLSELGINIEDYYLSDANTMTAQEATLMENTSTVKGQADIVFVIDTTGSMDDELSGVVANAVSFAESLESNYNVAANFSLVEFKDLEEDGNNTTRIIKNGASNWFNSASAFSSQVRTLTADGGGDTPECVVDALETARNLDFRRNAKKFIVLITDADYKLANNYGISSFEEEINLLKDDNIIVSVVTSSDLKETYQLLLDYTGGLFSNINENFYTVLMQLAQGIGQETSGSWVILKHGYRYIQLPEDDSNDWDGDGLLNVYELGFIETIDLSPFIKILLTMKGVPFEHYYGKTSIEVYDAVSDPTRNDTDSDGISDKKDTAPWAKGLKDGVVGALKICSYSDGPSSSGNFGGHAFVAYTSFIDDKIELYGILVESEEDTAKTDDTRSDRPKYHAVSMISDSVITIGGWAGWLPDELKGTWINNELMNFGDSVPSQQRSLMKYLKSSDVEKFTSLTKDNSKWTALYNCSAYAVDFWNEVTGDDLSARGALIFRNPSSLSYNIEKREGYKVAEALKAEWP